MCILWIRLIPGESVHCGDTGEFDELGNSGQGYINRGTCSSPELTSGHVLSSAYVIIF